MVFAASKRSNKWELVPIHTDLKLRAMSEYIIYYTADPFYVEYCRRL